MRPLLHIHLHLNKKHLHYDHVFLLSPFLIFLYIHIVLLQPGKLPHHSLGKLLHLLLHLQLYTPALFHKIQCQGVCHLTDHQPGFLKVIGTLEHLAGDDAFVFRLIGLDIGNGAGFPAPSVVDQKFRVDTKQPVQQLLVVKIGRLADGAAGDVAHGVQPMAIQLAGIALAHPPKVGQGFVPPQQLPIGHLVQCGNAHAILIRTDVFGDNIHSDFGQVQIGPQPGSGRDAGGFENVQNNGPGQVAARHMIRIQIVGDVYKDLVDGIHMDVLGGGVFQVYLIDLCAPVDIVGHSWPGHNVIQSQPGVALYLRVVPGQEPCPAGDAIGFQGRGDGQTDGLFRTPLIGYHKVGGHGIQAPFHTLHGGVKALEVAAEIALFFHAFIAPPEKPLIAHDWIRPVVHAVLSYN